MSRLKFKTVKSIENKVGDYLDKVLKGESDMSIAGLCLKLGISVKTFWEYERGLISTAPPEVVAKFQEMALIYQDYIELALMGRRGGKNAGAGAKFLATNYCGMSDKTSVTIDGGVSIYKQFEESADRSVERLQNELADEIKKELKGGE